MKELKVPDNKHTQKTQFIDDLLEIRELLDKQYEQLSELEHLNNRSLKTIERLRTNVDKLKKVLE